jgi:hypothetical protein
MYILYGDDMYDMNKYNFKLLALGGGIHTLSHIGETIGLQRYVVSVPTENFILAQQFPNKACKVNGKLNTFHIYIP